MEACRASIISGLSFTHILYYIYNTIFLIQIYISHVYFYFCLNIGELLFIAVTAHFYAIFFNMHNY